MWLTIMAFFWGKPVCNNKVDTWKEGPMTHTYPCLVVWLNKISVLRMRKLYPILYSWARTFCPPAQGPWVAHVGSSRPQASGKGPGKRGVVVKATGNGPGTPLTSSGTLSPAVLSGTREAGAPAASTRSPDHMVHGHGHGGLLPLTCARSPPAPPGASEAAP